MIMCSYDCDATVFASEVALAVLAAAAAAAAARCTMHAAAAAARCHLLPGRASFLDAALVVAVVGAGGGGAWVGAGRQWPAAVVVFAVVAHGGCYHCGRAVHCFFGGRKCSWLLAAVLIFGNHDLGLC